MNTKTLIAAMTLLLAATLTTTPTATADPTKCQLWLESNPYKNEVGLQCPNGYCGVTWQNGLLPNIDDVETECTNEANDVEGIIYERIGLVAKEVVCRLNPECKYDSLGYACMYYDPYEDKVHVIIDCGGPKSPEEYVQDLINPGGNTP